MLYRWWIIIGTFLTVFTAASGLRHLMFNCDTRAFFNEENPRLQALEAREDTYNRHGRNLHDSRKSPHANHP